MKKYLAIIALIITLPFGASAAPLTENQAISLIDVVQSSPETPASAFIGLITAFSKITNEQAQSLIVVVQAAPNAPDNAFVAMLLAFTVDPVIPQTTVLEQKIDTLTEKVNNLGSNPSPSNVIIKVMPNELSIKTIKQDPNKVLPLGRYHFEVTLTNDGKPVTNEIVKVTWPADHDKPIDIGGTSLYSGGSEVTEKTLTSSSTQFGPYVPTTKGSKTVVFSNGEVTQEVEIVIE